LFLVPASLAQEHHSFFVQVHSFDHTIGETKQFLHPGHMRLPRNGQNSRVSIEICSAWYNWPNLR